MHHPAKTLLFVYGTLKHGQRNHHLLAGQEYLGEVQTAAYYRLVDCGAYPGLVEDHLEGRSIQGEVYLIDEAMMHRLDILEGAPSLFKLQPIELETHSPKVFAYFYNRDTSELMDCGGVWPPRDSQW